MGRNDFDNLGTLDEQRRHLSRRGEQGHRTEPRSLPLPLLDNLVEPGPTWPSSVEAGPRSAQMCSMAGHMWSHPARHRPNLGRCRAQLDLVGSALGQRRRTRPHRFGRVRGTLADFGRIWPRPGRVRANSGPQSQILRRLRFGTMMQGLGVVLAPGSLSRPPAIDRRQQAT